MTVTTCQCPEPGPGHDLLCGSHSAEFSDVENYCECSCHDIVHRMREATCENDCGEGPGRYTRQTLLDEEVTCRRCKALRPGWYAFQFRPDGPWTICQDGRIVAECRTRESAHAVQRLLSGECERQLVLAHAIETGALV